MSILLMSRIFRQPMGGPTRKALAVRLADFADDEGRGIWPSVDRLAAETELSVRTVQRLLADFVEEGLLVLVKKASGRPGEANRYDFDLARLFAAPAAKESGPAPETTGDTMSPVATGGTGVTVTETGDTDDVDGCHGVTRTVIEPPVNHQERESAGAGSDGVENETRSAQRAFKRWYPTWPTYVDDSEPKAFGAWMKLSADERSAAVENTVSYIDTVKANGRKYVCSAQVYLAEKRWEKLPKSQAEHKPPQLANAYSRAWMGQHFAGLRQPMRRLSFTPLEERIIAADESKRVLLWDDKCRKHGWPDVTALHDKAREFKGVAVPTAIVQAAERMFDKVHVGGPVWVAWKRLHDRRRWPFPPPPDKLEFVQFPAIGTDEHDLDQAVERALSRFWADLTTGAGVTDDAA